MPIDPKDIELSDDERQILADSSRKTGRPWQQVLREAIANYLEDAETDAEACLKAQEKVLHKIWDKEEESE